MKNLVSIITPSFNSAKFIEQTIESVLSQTYTHWEMIIVDDNSKDNSIELIKKYSNSEERIKLIKLDENVGAAEARNIALRKADGKYIAFLDSDDIWLPQKLKIQLDFMKENNYNFTFSNYERITENGEFVNTIKSVSKISYQKFLQNTIIGTLTVIIDKEKIGYFEMPLIKSSHDMALWLKLLKIEKYAYGINQVLAKYRIVGNSNSAKKYKAIQDVWKVYREIEKIGFFKSLYYFSGYAINAILKRLK